jgi:hypothetical protein
MAKRLREERKRLLDSIPETRVIPQHEDFSLSNSSYKEGDLKK